MDHPPLVFTMAVGFTSQRPIIPDQHTAWVLIQTDTANDAHLAAAQMIGAWPHCVMVTRTTIVDVVC